MDDLACVLLPITHIWYLKQYFQISGYRNVVKYLTLSGFDPCTISGSSTQRL